MTIGFERVAIAVIIILPQFVCGIVDATPIAWTGHPDGRTHYYEVVAQAAPWVTWDEANAAAGGRSWLGTAGHLATVTSQFEQGFIELTVMPVDFAGTSVWLGGFQSPGPTSPAAGWHWVTTEPWSYTNWNPGEPNDAPHIDGGAETTLQMYFHHPDPAALDGRWNDFGTTPMTTGYIVEYAVTVPEPDTGLLLGLGLAFACRHIRKARSIKAASRGERIGVG